MKNRSRSAWIALTAGLALAGLVLMAGTAAAGTAPPEVWRAGAPATASRQWTSGWTEVPTSTLRVFNHNLGGDPDAYAVEMWFRDTDGGLGINRCNYGGVEMGDHRAGAFWRDLTANQISVYRERNDRVADSVRVRIWIPDPKPEDYQGDWTAIDPGETLTITHDVELPATELSVGLWFSGTRGRHHSGYGGLTAEDPTYDQGLFWHHLTDTTVQVTRLADDIHAEAIRVAVVHPEPPAYDSLQAPGGWRTIEPGTVSVFSHGLHWNPNLLMVRAECRAPAGEAYGGLHHHFAGGNHDPSSGWQGVHIQNLTADTVAVARRQDDQVCPEVRVRVWRRAARVYLPLTMRGS
jgi:hypothetical protein